MARKLRVQYEGAIYHVMNRGDHREDIFENDSDRELFLKTLGEACAKTAWQIHAYCLMRNHFHVVVETPRANLVAGPWPAAKGSVPRMSRSIQVPPIRMLFTYHTVLPT